MARRERAPMLEEDLVAMVDGQIADAREYVRSDLQPDRDLALKFLQGEVDIPQETGRSSITSRDLSDVLGWIMPSLLRVFLASDKVIVYEPRRPIFQPDEQGRPKDIAEEQAEQKTAYVNYVFLEECDGFNVLQSALTDGLSLGNGIIKHWWDGAPEFKTEIRQGLTFGQLYSLLSSDEVESVTGFEHYPDPMLQGREGMFGDAQDHLPLGMGQPPPPGPIAVPEPGQGVLYNVRFKRRIDGGRLRVKALPPEQLLITRGATKLDEEVPFIAHRYKEIRSNLRLQGYDPEVIDDVGETSDSFEADTTRAARGEAAVQRFTEAPDEATEQVDVYECYVLCDYDGDGIAERRKVVMAGGVGEYNLLENEEWAGDLPFTDLVPDPVPHRWRGNSLFDSIYDLQRLKTFLLRATLDNLNLVNNPMTEIETGSVDNIDALFNRTLGGNVFVKRKGSITPLEVPFTAKESFAMLEYCDQVIERRTGVSRATMALDMDALQNQTATAVNASQAAATSKTEFFARNIKEGGMKRFGRCLLKLVCDHQDRPKMIRLRGQWVEMDPTQWDPDMDVDINSGLGTGNRERDLALIGAVTAKQEQIMQLLGPSNPLIDLKMYRDTLAKGVEAANLRNPDQFFKQVTDEDLAQYQQAQGQKPDPKAQAEQAKLQMEAAKAQQQAQLEQARAQHEMQLAEQKHAMDLQHREQELAAKAQFDRDKAAADMQTTRDKAAAEIIAQRERNAMELQLMREKAAQEMRLKEQELSLEAELKRESMRIERQAQQANIEEASPQ